MNKHVTFLSIVLSVAAVLAVPAIHAQTTVAANPAGGKSPWNFSASLSLKETFDDNVFLQDHTALAHRRSFVSSFTPTLALGFQESAAFKITGSYAPEVAFYHSCPSENNVAHRLMLNLGGKSGDTAWEINNAVTVIDGSDRGPTFDPASGGDIPAVGGIPLRDRRDAVVYRNNIKLTQTIGRCFVRPVFTSYVHDFRTHQSGDTGYENYIDRFELNIGLDAGYEVQEKTWLVLGYRYGHQHQGSRLGVASAYGNYYHRFLAGVEGAPTDWLKLSVLVGPDLRDFPSDRLPLRFKRSDLLWYVDAAATLTCGKADTVTLLATRYEQPAFSSQSVYEDVVYSCNWRHQCTSNLAGTVGMKVYEGNWQRPANRDDWIFTPSVGVTYTFNKHFSADCAWSYDAVNSEVPHTLGREFTRHLVSLGAKYTF